jgi:hypothetical protein
MPDENPDEKPAAERQSAGGAESSLAAQGENKSFVHGESMEIHSPDKPIHSKKEFLFHMFTVVLGILIALAMEGGVEWFHHRALVREARENILAEVRKNKETVDESVQEIHKQEADLSHIIDLMHKIESDRTAIKNQSMHFGVTMHDLYSTAWQTATNSGAVTYMKYDELIRYTDLYLTQQAFTSLQEQALNRMIEGGSLIEVTMKEDDMKKVPVEKFQAIAQEAYKEQIVEKALENISEALTKGYDDLLKQQ